MGWLRPWASDLGDRPGGPDHRPPLDNTTVQPDSASEVRRPTCRDVLARTGAALSAWPRTRGRGGGTAGHDKDAASPFSMQGSGRRVKRHRAVAGDRVGSRAGRATTAEGIGRGRAGRRGAPWRGEGGGPAAVRGPGSVGVGADGRHRAPRHPWLAAAAGYVPIVAERCRCVYTELGSLSQKYGSSPTQGSALRRPWSAGQLRFAAQAGGPSPVAPPDGRSDTTPTTERPAFPSTTRRATTES